ncbi:response regulator transcription factor [Prolixibacteraceae bacterium JC049]|nr:response regulator transcription factor [Prolixibacteraceae bacterium JC049]
MKNDKRVLLVEDDATLAFLVADNLKREGYQVTHAEDGVKGLAFFQEDEFDICLVDVMMPNMDGFAFTQEIRKVNEQVPIIFITARNLTEDKIKGLKLGGDDYITKPFSMEELLLKIQIFLKRSRVAAEAESKALYHFGIFSFDSENLQLGWKNEQRELTMKEAKLLQLFCEKHHQVLSRSEILEAVWGDDDYFLGRSLDVFISRLRKYLKVDPQVKIANLHGIGFRFTY